jgi:arsenate reductase
MTVIFKYERQSPMIIYHNPRCSKSRQTLALIEESGIKPSIVNYLVASLTAVDIKDLLNKLGVDVRSIIRSGEDAYKELDLSNSKLSEQQLIAAIVTHPKLLERPIVVKGNNAIIGRPPENVLPLL